MAITGPEFDPRQVPALLRAWRDGLLLETLARPAAAQPDTETGRIAPRSGITAPRATPAVPADPTRLPADGPHPGDRAVLREVQLLLRRCPIDDAVALAFERLVAQRPMPAREVALAERAQAADALRWLVEHLDRPAVVATACSRLGPALARLGVDAPQLATLGLIMSDALRASMGTGFRPDIGDAWRTTWRLVSRWMGDGVAAYAHEPPFWTAVVTAVAGEPVRRGRGGSVLRMRTYLPYPGGPGEEAVVEHPALPGQWRAYPIVAAGSLVAAGEVGIRVAGADEVAVALVEHTIAGDRLRLRPPRPGRGGPGGPSPEDPGPVR